MQQVSRTAQNVKKGSTLNVMKHILDMSPTGCDCFLYLSVFVQNVSM